MHGCGCLALDLRNHLDMTPSWFVVLDRHFEAGRGFDGVAKKTGHAIGVCFRIDESSDDMSCVVYQPNIFWFTSMLVEQARVGCRYERVGQSVSDLDGPRRDLANKVNDGHL